MLAAVGIDDILCSAEILFHLFDLLVHLGVLGADGLRAIFKRCLQVSDVGVDILDLLLDFGSLLLCEFPTLANPQLVGYLQEGLDVVKLVSLLRDLLVQGRDLHASAGAAVLDQGVNTGQLLVEG